MLTQVSNWTQSSEPYCPSEGYQVNATTAGLVTYSQAYWDSWFSPVDSVRVCNATEFAFSCAPFQVKLALLKGTGHWSPVTDLV